MPVEPIARHAHVMQSARRLVRDPPQRELANDASLAVEACAARGAKDTHDLVGRVAAPALAARPGDDRLDTTLQIAARDRAVLRIVMALRMRSLFVLSVPVVMPPGMARPDRHRDEQAARHRPTQQLAHVSSPVVRRVRFAPFRRSRGARTSYGMRECKLMTRKTS
jgi:hypothetical protein